MFIEFVTSHDNNFNNQINFSICTFLNGSYLRIKKKSQSGPKNKIDAKNSENNLITQYYFIDLFSPCFYMESPRVKSDICRNATPLRKNLNVKIILICWGHGFCKGLFNSQILLTTLGLNFKIVFFCAIWEEPFGM